MDIVISNSKNVFNSMMNNTGMFIVVICIIVAIVSFIFYKIYRKMIGFCEDFPAIIKEPRPADFAYKDVNDNTIIKLLTGGLFGQGEKMKVLGYNKVDHNKLSPPEFGYDYSYSVWINVSEWNYNNNLPKHIFHKGDPQAKIVNPGVWLYPNTNALMIRVSTFGEITNISNTVSNNTCQYWDAANDNREDVRTHTIANKDKWFIGQNYSELRDNNFCRNPDNDEKGTWCYPRSNESISGKTTTKEYCDLKDWKEGPPVNPYINNKNDLSTRAKCDIINIPLQRWVHIVLVMHNRTLDVYLNGKLARSCTYENIPKYNDGDIHYLMDGGFKGEIGQFRYFNRALDATEVYDWYKCGNKCIKLYDYLCDINANVDINISGNIGSSNFSDSANLKI